MPPSKLLWVVKAVLFVIWLAICIAAWFALTDWRVSRALDRWEKATTHAFQDNPPPKR